VHEMADKYRQLCAMEPQMMESLLQVPVTREKYILRNDPICAYVIKPQEQV